MEKWKKIKDYPDYEVSTLGRIRSHKHNKSRIMKQHLVNSGYKTLILREGGRSRRLTVHRLVAKAFVANDNDKPQVNHLDGNKQSNRSNNLEWCTGSENRLHAFKTGLRKPHHKMIGEGNGRSILNRHQVKRLRLMKEICPKITYKRLSEIFRIGLQGAYAIIKRKTWKHI